MIAGHQRVKWKTRLQCYIQAVVTPKNNIKQGIRKATNYSRLGALSLRRKILRMWSSRWLVRILRPMAFMPTAMNLRLRP